MRTSLRALLFASSLVALSSVPALADNLLTNGGFETGDFSGFTTSNLNATFVSSGYVGYVPHSGNFFAALGNVGSAGQIMSSTFTDTPGATYAFSFYLASNGTPNTFSAAVDGTTVFGPTDVGSSPYTLYTFNFTGTGSDNISFAEQDDPSYIALDDVSVSTVSSVTPEPSSLVLLASGMTGVAGLMRRRSVRG